MRLSQLQIRESSNILLEGNLILKEVFFQVIFYTLTGLDIRKNIFMLRIYHGRLQKKLLSKHKKAFEALANE